MKRTITAAHQRWLAGELRAWQSAGLVDEATAATIESSYDVVSGKRMNLAKLLLGIGGAFVGIGIIWLIAANIDALSPMVRLGAVFALFAAALIGAEKLDQQRQRDPDPVVGSVRLVASLLLGGVIFQAAQSLQVPAYEPLLLGLWSIGAVLYAYLMRALMPLIVGVATGLYWLVAAQVDSDFSGFGFVITAFAAAVFSLGVAHLPAPQQSFTTVWRETGVALALVGLFAAAIPDLTTSGFEWTRVLVIVVVAAAVAALGSLRNRTGWLEVGATVGIAVLGVLLVLWEAGRDADNVDLSSWAHAGLSVTVYVGAALWSAYLGIVHDSPRLTLIATAALVVFTTFQAFAVFAAIIQGAWLFVFLGLVLAGTGYLFDRARRELAANIEGEAA